MASLAASCALRYASTYSAGGLTPCAADALKLSSVFLAAVAALVDSILNDQKKLFPCCVYLDGEYGQKDICLGVPVIIGKNGWEKIVDIKLNEEEKAVFNKSADAVRNMNNVLSTIAI